MTDQWLAPNPRNPRGQPYGEAQRAVVTAGGLPEVRDMLAACPRHGPTPLYRMSGMADALGLGLVTIKDESRRFGFGAFKALGGIFAIGQLLAREASVAAGRPVRAAELLGESAVAVPARTFATASSGNHGRAVAAGARLFGHACAIFLPGFASPEKEAAIRARGAEVIRVEGDYERAVAECRSVSATRGWTVISDTSWEGYTDIPRAVMQGYSVLTDEALSQARAAGMGKIPTHVFVQAGVGGLAAAVIGPLWEQFLFQRPVTIVVEPETADCWFQSNHAGRPASASGDATTSMGGLACREISPMTWPVIGEGADWFMTIAESHVAPAMRRLARQAPGDPRIVAGPSGSAGVAALMRVCADPVARAKLRLGQDSRVLLIVSENAAGDPGLFREATGLSIEDADAGLLRPRA